MSNRCDQPELKAAQSFGSRWVETAQFPQFGLPYPQILPMDRAALPRSAPVTVAFQDGLGERHHIVHPNGGETLELLRLRPELATVPSFEFALRERLSRLSRFRHASYSQVYSVERIPDRGSTLAVVSALAPGFRLSEVLANAAGRKVGVDIDSALCLIRQLVPAVAILHQHARDTAHGCIAPERIVIGPNARLVVVEHVLGSALEQLRFSPERYWQELRVAVPFSSGQPRFDHRGDVLHIGLVALALILGRPLTDEEYPGGIADLVASTWAISARGGFEPLPPGLRGWLGRTLQLDPATGFASVTDARTELDRVLGDADRVASRERLEAFLARYNAGAPAKPPVSRAAGEQKTLGARPPGPVQPPAKNASAARIPAAAKISAAPQLRTAVQTPAQTATRLEPSPADRPPFSTGHYESGPGHSLFGEKNEQPGGPPVWLRVAGGLALLGLLAVAGVFAGRSYFLASPAAGTTGTLEVTTNPDGVDAFIDGRGRGLTPLTVTLPVGKHVVEVRGPTGVARSVPVTIEGGNLTSQHIELPSEAVATGQLQIRTDPPGATVSVDGVSRGTSPTTLAGLSPGEHQVVLDGDLGSVTETVTIDSGLTASLDVPLVSVPAGPVSGWVSVSSSVELQLYEGGNLLGMSVTDRIMLESGRHEIELVNEALGYRSSHIVEVMPGQVAPIAVEMPEGVIALNAVPWAEVWIDGVRIGETPIGNHGLPIGRHSVLFRHPELGEQHHTAAVTLNDVTRLSVDMKAPVRPGEPIDP